MSVLGRMGCFLMLVGGALILLYLLSDQASKPQLNLLFLGALIFLVGIPLWRKGQPPPRDTGRFRTLRKMRGKDKKE